MFGFYLYSGHKITILIKRLIDANTSQNRKKTGQDQNLMIRLGNMGNVTSPVTRSPTTPVQVPLACKELF